MNKNVDKAITEGNNKGPKINKLTKSIITTTDSKSNSNQYYKNLKLKDKKGRKINIKIKNYFLYK